jgi:hypothetical protein
MISYWHLSQKDLNLLATCPLQFQQYYWQKLDSLPNLTQVENADWGKQFHTLMQQYNLGLPWENVLSQQPEFKQALKALISATEAIWHSPQIKFREAEYQLKFTWQNYIFSVVYDLLVLSEDYAIIFDWKTYLQPKNQQKLLTNWQTKLYLYVLAESLNYQAEQLYFTYWFVKLPQQPQSYTIKYNQNFHNQTKIELKNLVNKFEQILLEYPLTQNKCKQRHNCVQCSYYQTVINNHQAQNDLNNLPLSLEEVEEVNISVSPT